MAPSISVVASTSRSEPKPLIRASKEWVVPPRPKPGRKSTKVSTAAAADGASGKPNQKAFRARRQDHVAVLEDRVRQLEADEGEKCVFYQQQAQKAKSETAALQQENTRLRQEVDSLRAELAASRTVYGNTAALSNGPRARTALSDLMDAGGQAPAKRQRRAGSQMSRAQSASSPSAQSASPPAFHANSAASPIAYMTNSPILDPQPEAPMSPQQHTVSLQIPRCNFCSTGPDCFCAQVGFDIAQTPSAADAEKPDPFASRMIEEDPFGSQASYQPAVPLRLRRADGPKKKAATVWALEPAATGAARLIDAAKAVCSGDPSNCPACSDDAFGKAFCSALSSSVCTNQPCSSCPSKRSAERPATPPPPPPIDEGMALLESLTDLPCCGDPILCGSKVCKTDSHAPDRTAEPAQMELPAVETVPCNEAWAALKQHPNIGFADLQMLAEVVAKRTFCKGPITETPPAPAGVTSVTFPAPHKTSKAFLQSSETAAPRRRLTVERGAVNEALGILDRAGARL